jgi:CelD/BcsL family acetyltransferase involved in cellulose biosynthesis
MKIELSLDETQKLLHALFEKKAALNNLKMTSLYMPKVHTAIHLELEETDFLIERLMSMQRGIVAQEMEKS